MLLAATHCPHSAGACRSNVVTSLGNDTSIRLSRNACFEPFADSNRLGTSATWQGGSYDTRAPWLSAITWTLR